MIIALATLNPNHEIFAKSYKPQVERPSIARNELLVNNADGFFTGLPQLTKAKDLKGRRMGLMTQEQRLELKMAQQQDQIHRAQEKIKKYQVEKEQRISTSKSQKAAGSFETLLRVLRNRMILNIRIEKRYFQIFSDNEFA